MSSVRLSGNAGGTGIFTIESPSSNNNRTVTLPDSAGTAVVASAGVTAVGQIPFSTDGSTYTPTAKIVADTAKSATSTSVDFTGIPSWVKRITVMFNGVSTSGTSTLIIQLGDAGGFETTGYSSTAQNGPNVGVDYTTGLPINNTSTAALAYSGLSTIALIGSNAWVFNSMMRATGFVYFGAGQKSTSDTLTQVRITTVNGTDTFDAGTINILYE